MAVPNVTFNNGVQIPQLGFGVFKVRPADTAEAVEKALRVGYRHIDTAKMYGNERQVRLGIEASGVDPAQVFVTSKITMMRTVTARLWLRSISHLPTYEWSGSI